MTMKKLYTRRTGFTLMEVLIVVAVIFALFALLLPLINNQWKRWQIRQVEMEISNINSALLQFQADHRADPTTEQGLRALVFIPDGMGQPGQQPLAPGYGVPGGIADPNSDPYGGMGNGSAVIGGPGQLNSVNMMDPSGGTMMQPNGMITGGGMMPTDPNNPMAGGSAMIGGPGGVMGSGNDPLGNPNLYTRGQRRPDPYITEKQLIDPFGNPYRYDNSKLYPSGIGGLNRTGTDRPAVWSVGRDGVDGTPDDILGWKQEDADEAFLAYQQQMQLRGGTSPVIGAPDPMNPYGTTGVGTDPYNMNMQSPLGPMGPGVPTGPMGPGVPTGPMGPGVPPGPMGPGVPPGPMGTGVPPGPMGTGVPPGPMGTGVPPTGF
jgi:type II secretion system protein G